jgi:hypothetical protein
MNDKLVSMPQLIHDLAIEATKIMFAHRQSDPKTSVSFLPAHISQALFTDYLDAHDTLRKVWEIAIAQTEGNLN